MEEITQVKALLRIANELDWIFWLIFWMWMFDAFKTTVEYKDKKN